MRKTTGRFVLAALWGAAALSRAVAADAPAAKSFGDELQFLKQYVDVVVLSDPHSGARVAVVPAYQGRVMTSSAKGATGQSYGWINHELVSSRKFVQHINAFGGEDRFWLGPEGGQYALFFKKGVPFDLEHWFTPASIDTQAYMMATGSRDRVRFRKAIHLANYSNAKFNLMVDRQIRLLKPAETWRNLGVSPARGVSMVAYETDNQILNTGPRAWTRPTGLLSIWILGMFNPSPTTTIVIPFKPGPVSKLGPIVNDAYFGKVPADRLIVKDNVLFFRGDGQYRSKIGIPPLRARPVLGSYDSATHVLTLVQFTLPARSNGYVNSMWQIQKQPYGGDAANSYNDGPPKPGAKPLGPFYEVESSSPAAALRPGQSILHVHRTIHLQGPESALDPIARKMLGVPLSQIKAAFGSGG